MRSSVKALLPVPARRALRGARLHAWSLVDTLSRNRAAPVGAGGLIGDGDFAAVGEEFLAYFRELGGLTPTDDVLDVGCGAGRMAIPLTAFLDGGSYRGFDVMAPLVHSCRRRIGTRFPAFRFDHLDVYNGKYNAGGSIAPDELRFPYDDDAFDFAFATSVFTHMLRQDVERYLGELARVLRPGGCALVTWYLVSAETRRLIDDGRPSPPFLPAGDGQWVTDPKEPEAAVAYDEDLVRDLHAASGLELVTVRYGTWRGTPGLSTQDIVVARAA